MADTVHKFWHRYSKGMCLTCGYHCIDCPKDVASCKCTPKPPHVYTDECRIRYCKIHWVYSFHFRTHVKYPEDYVYLSSRHGWINQKVYCGPGAYLPKKEKKNEST